MDKSCDSTPAATDPAIDRRYAYAQSYIDACQRRLRRVALPLIVAGICVMEVSFYRAIHEFSEDPPPIEFFVVVGLTLTIVFLITGFFASRIGMRRTARMMNSATYRFESDALVFSILVFWDFCGIPFTRTVTRRFNLDQILQIEVGDMRYPDELRARLKFANKGWLPTLKSLVIPTLENMGEFIAELEQRLPGKVIYVDETLSPWTLRVVLRKLVVVAVMIFAIACAVLYGLP